jgi:hypothetical protein
MDTLERLLEYLDVVSGDPNAHTIANQSNFVQFICTELDEIRKQLESMKCCGNCYSREDICFDCSGMEPAPRIFTGDVPHVCDNWKPRKDPQ